MTATAPTDRRELAHRTGDGSEATLFWSKQANRVTVAAPDTRPDHGPEFEFGGGDALGAFNYP